MRDYQSRSFLFVQMAFNQVGSEMSINTNYSFLIAMTSSQYFSLERDHGNIIFPFVLDDGLGNGLQDEKIYFNIVSIGSRMSCSNH